MCHPTWVDTEAMPWSGSPAEGVERKRLELIGSGEPQLTTLVRFAAGSSFPQHAHDGGEEFLVLEGTFSDERGHYPAGTYVRNPPASSHAPYTESGCTLLVKLRQFQSGDDRQLVVDSGKETWERIAPGAERLSLHRWGDEQVFLMRSQPGYAPEDDFFARGVELWVISGELAVGQGVAPAGTWLRFPPGTSRQIIACYGGGSCYVKQGPAHRYAERASV
jgi:hypothetical protein